MATPSAGAAAADRGANKYYKQIQLVKITQILRRTKNLMHQLSVSLEDMYNGSVRKLALQKNVICDGCG